MFPDPLFAVPDAISNATLTVLPALLAGPGAVAILVVGAVTIATVGALVRTARGQTGVRTDTPKGRLRVSSRAA